MADKPENPSALAALSEELAQSEARRTLGSIPRFLATPETPREPQWRDPGALAEENRLRVDPSAANALALAQHAIDFSMLGAGGAAGARGAAGMRRPRQTSAIPIESVPQKRTPAPKMSPDVVVAAKSGDPAATSQFLAALEPIIHKITRSYRGSPQHEDVLQVARESALKLIPRYDPTWFKTPTNALFENILRDVTRFTDESRSVPLSVADNSALRKINRIIGEHQVRTGRTPLPVQIAQKTGLDRETVDRLLQVPSPIDRGLLEPSLRSTAAAPDIETTPVPPEVSERAAVNEALGRMSRHDREILLSRMRGETQQTMADRLGITQPSLALQIPKIEATFQSLLETGRAPEPSKYAPTVRRGQPPTATIVRKGTPGARPAPEPEPAAEPTRLKLRLTKEGQLVPRDLPPGISMSPLESSLMESLKALQSRGKPMKNFVTDMMEGAPVKNVPGETDPIKIIEAAGGQVRGGAQPHPITGKPIYWTHDPVTGTTGIQGLEGPVTAEGVKSWLAENKARFDAAAAKPISGGSDVPELGKGMKPAEWARLKLLEKDDPELFKRMRESGMVPPEYTTPRPIGGGADISPEQQEFNKNWAAAYKESQTQPKGLLATRDPKDYTNLPPRLGPPPTGNKLAVLDELRGLMNRYLREAKSGSYAGREADPKMLTQLERMGKQNRVIELPGGIDYPEDQIADAMHRAGRREYQYPAWESEDPTGLPHVVSSPGRRGMPLMAIKGEAWMSPLDRIREWLRVSPPSSLHHGQDPPSDPVVQAIMDRFYDTRPTAPFHGTTPGGVEWVRPNPDPNAEAAQRAFDALRRRQRE